ncbi:MAG: HAMP domain-containing protein, partial [Calditrichaceae bacterium]|nr:HAMP domain-containing protein [Calditrichaceae bacterium]
MFKSLKFQFVFYFLIFSFIPLVIFSILGFFLNRTIIENMHRAHLLDTGTHISSQIKNFFKLKDQLANSLYANHEYRLKLADEELLFEKADISSIYNLPDVVIYKDQTIISHKNKPEDTEDHLQAALNNKDYNLVILPGKKLYYKTEINDQIRLFQSIDLNELSDLLEYPESTLIIKLISKSGNFLITQDAINFTTKYQADSGQDANLIKLEPLHINDDLILLCFKSRAGMDAELISFLTEILIINVIIGLLMLFSAIFFSRRIINPIDSLVRAINKISKGDLNEPINVKSQDEIRALADEFEKMRMKLRESYVDLENKIEERTQALRDAQFQISHQEKMASLGLLAAGVAHEIGNPLTSISSMAQIIKRKVKDQNFIEYLNTILKNIDRIRKIVRELVDFARPSSYEAADTNINEIIRNAVGIVKYDRRAKSINIELELDNNLPAIFLVADQLLQVFLNILINAVDALKDDQNRIVIRSSKQAGNIIIQFEDEGVGIEPENISKIFEPFYTTKKVGKGTGL